jgi:hypothetical protein
MNARDRGQLLQRRVHVRSGLAEEHALPVRRVRADAHIGRHSELGHGFLHGADRARHDVIGLARKHRVLVLAIGDAEDEKPGETL